MPYIIPSSSTFTVPFWLVTSDGTSPDTGASGDSLALYAGGSNSSFIPDLTISAVHAAAGQYQAVLTPSETSQVGALWGYHTQGSFQMPVFAAEVRTGSLSTLNPAAVNAEVDTALTDYDAVVPADLPTNFGDLAITVTTGKVTVGTNDDKTGYSISGTKTTLDDLNDVSTAEVNAEADTALTDYDPPTRAELTSDINSLNDLSAAQVNAEVDSAIETYGLDHLLAAAVAGTDVTDNSIIAQLVSASATADWDDFDNTTEALQALRDWIGDGTNLTETGGDGDHLTEAGGTGDHLTALPESDANVTKISGDATAADRLEALMDAAIVAQVNDASATTTAFAADGFTEATDDHFNGRLITFISGALSGQQTAITDYDAADHAQGSQAFVVDALTEAPANDDFFIIT